MRLITTEPEIIISPVDAADTGLINIGIDLIGESEEVNFGLIRVGEALDSRLSSLTLSAIGLLAHKGKLQSDESLPLIDTSMTQEDLDCLMRLASQAADQIHGDPSWLALSLDECQ